ncbi:MULTISPECIES: Nif11-like leader peptide family natural product precursor [unclassified Nostoc]|uniref:Nif11-like leader peptide family natural product precursor n=1 Tax=unclassified Nostoc TaxID=2593658 RepID=UPI002AD3DAC3|nr:Nif11-like leader peptide family natural product precursor [Nostoc sp. DedQUE03]MDZ7975001.1 Nif11-like leader peptide family natural product precursor [Nostoc sp. DedQUE03]MDZ8046636.1 Nif11-like leader peptide family natural product precursor [Nostoc sp. DedQUE02]
MSNPKVEEFLNTIADDPSLQGEVAAALESDNDREAVTALAKSRGYEFSSDELWAEIQKRQAEFSHKEEVGELSDEELEAVAGGVTPTVIITGITVAAGVGGLTTGIGVSKIKW